MDLFFPYPLNADMAFMQLRDLFKFKGKDRHKCSLATLYRKMIDIFFHALAQIIVGKCKSDRGKTENFKLDLSLKRRIVLKRILSFLLCVRMRRKKCECAE